MSLLNDSLFNVMESFNKSMSNQYSVLQESLKQSQAASKEAYLSNAPSCDGKNPKDFSTWLGEVKRLSVLADKSLVDVAIATSRGTLHKHIMELHLNGSDWDTIKIKLQERLSPGHSESLLDF